MRAVGQCDNVGCAGLSPPGLDGPPLSHARTTTTLRFLGAGGAFSRRFGTTCSELRLGDGTRWLLDCGRQAPDQLYAAGLSWHEVDGQIITHAHGDHLFGLEDFAFSRYFIDGAVPAIRNGGPKAKLVSHSAVVREIWEAMAPSLRYGPDTVAPGAGTLGDYFDVLVAVSSESALANPWPQAERFVAGGLVVTLRETLHVPGKPSTSIEIDLDNGNVAWWSGDSIVDSEFLEAIEPHTTVFFHDCTFVDYPGQVHGAFQQLERLPDRVRRKMVLMHHEDDVEVHRHRAEAVGFRIGMPGDVYDLERGRRLG